MTQHVLVAAGLIAAAASSAAVAGDVQVSKFRYADPLIAAVFVCPGTVAPSDCDARSASQSIVEPPWAREVGCGAGRTRRSLPAPDSV